MLNVDWPKVVNDLLAGESMTALSGRLGVPRSTLFRYQDGATPRWPVGHALLRLWAERTGRPVAEVPVVRMATRHAVRTGTPRPRPEVAQAFADLAEWHKAIVTEK